MLVYGQALVTVLDFELLLHTQGLKILPSKQFMLIMVMTRSLPQVYEGKSTYWASYSFGDLLVAAEIAEASKSTDAGTDLDGSLFMGNYAFTDKVGLTLRYSTTELQI